MLKPIFGALVILVSLSVNAKAATYNIAGSFDGGLLGLVEFDFDVSGDFSTDIPATAIASENINLLTTEGADFTPSGGLGFEFLDDPNGGILAFGGLGLSVRGSGPGTNDFVAAIFSLFNTPFLELIVDTSESVGGGLGSPNALTLTVTEISAVPLPAALPFLVTALGVFGFMTRIRQRKAIETS